MQQLIEDLKYFAEPIIDFLKAQGLRVDVREGRRRQSLSVTWSTGLTVVCYMNSEGYVCTLAKAKTEATLPKVREVVVRALAPIYGAPNRRLTPEEVMMGEALGWFTDTFADLPQA